MSGHRPTMVDKDRVIGVLMGTPWKLNEEQSYVVDYETWAKNIMEIFDEEAKAKSDIR